MNRSMLTILVVCSMGCGAAVEGEPEPRGSGGPTGGKADIIGEDDREELYQQPDALRGVLDASAAVVSSSLLVPAGDTYMIRGAQTLAERHGVCTDEAFSDQLVAASCSAWLVAPDRIITNGHCVPNAETCARKSFVFGYAVDEPGDRADEVSTDDVFQCKRVLYWSQRSCESDFAIIELDREVEGREPLKVRESGRAPEGTEYTLVGYPMGLPMKVVRGATLRPGAENFEHLADSIFGNSGSFLFDESTGLVDALHACRGTDEDVPGRVAYFTDEQQEDGSTCRREVVCDEDGSGCSSGRRASYGRATRSSVFASLLRPTIEYVDAEEYVFEDGETLWFELDPELDADVDKVVVRFTGVDAFFTRQTIFGSIERLRGVSLQIDVEGKPFPYDVCVNGAGCVGGTSSSYVDPQTGHVHMTFVLDAREIGASRLDKDWTVSLGNVSSERFVARDLTVEFAPALEE